MWFAGLRQPGEQAGVVARTAHVELVGGGASVDVGRDPRADDARARVRRSTGVLAVDEDDVEVPASAVPRGQVVGGARADDPRTEQQRRSDLFADLLLGRLQLVDDPVPVEIRALSLSKGRSRSLSKGR